MWIFNVVYCLCGPLLCNATVMGIVAIVMLSDSGYCIEDILL